MEEIQSAVDGKPHYHPQMHYMHNDLHPLSNGTMIHHVEGDADPGNMSDNHNGLLFARGSIEDTNQLTLSFQGQVYVFDSVSPEKDLSSTHRRLASLMRFREKRKERNFEKKIRYTVRKEVALSCRHCGVNEKSTPMMRKGPDGPKTLCNACGLMWANKVMPKLPFLLMLVMPALHSC
ncbi:putative transcription factor TIFY family [Helianthus debilis subsp. tardiflorus]